jgi:hypothetical protein
MNSVFINAAIIALVYFLAKFLEMRHVEKESKPLKYLVKDSLIVYFCVIAGDFILNQIQSNVMSGGSQNFTPAFTDNPNF